MKMTILAPITPLRDLLSRVGLALAGTMAATGSIAFMVAATDSARNAVGHLSLALVFLLAASAVVWQLITDRESLHGARLAMIVATVLLAVGMHRGFRIDDAALAAVLATALVMHPRRHEIINLEGYRNLPLRLLTTAGALVFLVLGVTLLPESDIEAPIAAERNYGLATMLLSLAGSAAAASLWPARFTLGIVGIVAILAAAGGLVVGDEIVPGSLFVFLACWGTSTLGAAAFAHFPERNMRRSIHGETRDT